MDNELVSEAQSFNQSSQSSRLVPSAGVAEEETGKYGTPVFQHLFQLSLRDEFLYRLLQHCSDSYSVQDRLSDQIGLVEGQELRERILNTIQLPRGDIIILCEVTY